MNANPLRTVFLHVTKACNLSCKYCYFSARHALPDEMSLSEFETIFKDLVQIAPTKVVLTGGEPLVRRDLLQIIEGLKRLDAEHRIIRCLNTNGLLVTDGLAGSLIGLVDEVRVSVDGLQKRNDAVRGVGSFEAAVAALQCFYRAGFEPKALITITRDCLTDLPELIAFLRGINISRININAFRPVGRGAECPEIAVDRCGIARVLNLAGVQLTDESTKMDDSSTVGCGVGRFLNILPNGDVFPCHVLTNPLFRLGNLRERSLREIYFGDLLRRLRGAANGKLLAESDRRLDRLLTLPSPCMGELFASTQDSPAWKNVLHPSAVIAREAEAGLRD